MKNYEIRFISVFALLCAITNANTETKNYTITENEIGFIAMAESCALDQQKISFSKDIKTQANGRGWEILADYSIASNQGFQSTIVKGEVSCAADGDIPERIVVSISLTVRNANRNPYIVDTSKNIKLRTNNSGAYEAGSKRIATFDPDGDQVLITTSERLPSGFSFDVSTGVLSWRLLSRDETESINANGKIIFSIGDINSKVVDSVYVAREGVSLPILITRYLGGEAAHGNRLIATNRNKLQYRLFNPNNSTSGNLSVDVYRIETNGTKSILGSNFDPNSRILTLSLVESDLGLSDMKPGESRALSLQIQANDGGHSGILDQEFIALGSRSAEQNAEKVTMTLKRVAALEIRVFNKKENIEKTKAYLKWIPIVFDAIGGLGGITAWAEGATLTGGIAGVGGIAFIAGTKIYSLVTIDRTNADDSALVAIGRYNENILEKSRLLSSSASCNAVDTIGACEAEIKEIENEIKAVCPNLRLKEFNCNAIPIDSPDDALIRLFNWAPRKVKI